MQYKDCNRPSSLDPDMVIRLCHVISHEICDHSSPVSVCDVSYDSCNNLTNLRHNA